jgi:hypothetical protein
LRLRERKKDTESRKRRERRGERRTDGDNFGRKQPSPPRREKGCGLKRARCLICFWIAFGGVVGLFYSSLGPN